MANKTTNADFVMVDLTGDSDDNEVYSTPTNEKAIVNVSTETDSDDETTWYWMKDCFEPKVGPAMKRPNLKMTDEQKDAYDVKYGKEGHSLRQKIETVRITKITSDEDELQTCT